MRRIFFVGIHNKSPFGPLDVRSASGKRLQAAIDLLDFQEGEIIKSNLFNVDYLPTDKDEIINFGDEWLKKHEPKSNDVIVLLGGAVQEVFPPTDSIVIKHGHPSPMFSKESTEQYAYNLTMKIMLSILVPNDDDNDDIKWIAQ